MFTHFTSTTVHTNYLLSPLIISGFMRKNESEQVANALRNFGFKLNVVDASHSFYNATTTIKGSETLPLNQTYNPEEKRKIIGDTFMRVTEREIRNLNLRPEDMFVAQGTLRPGEISFSQNGFDFFG